MFWLIAPRNHPVLSGLIFLQFAFEKDVIASFILRAIVRAVKILIESLTLT